MHREIMKFINSDFFKSIFTILISTSITFLLTKSKEGKIDKKEIYKIQLEKIFLPLYLLASRIDINNTEISSIVNLVDNMSQKSKRYYLYIPSTYISLNEKTHKFLQNNTISKKQMMILVDYIIWKYFDLKKKLNYPEQKFFIFGNFFSMYNLFKCIMYFCFVMISISFMFLIYLGSYLYINFYNFYNLLMVLLFIGFLGIAVIVSINIVYEISLFLTFRCIR